MIDTKENFISSRPDWLVHQQEQLALARSLLLDTPLRDASDLKRIPVDLAALLHINSQFFLHLEPGKYSVRVNDFDLELAVTANLNPFHTLSKEGFFNLNLSLRPAAFSTSELPKLFEVGFVINPQQFLLISKVQFHTLGMYLGRSNNKSIEKKHGDTVLEKLKKYSAKSDLIPEALGLIFALRYLSKFWSTFSDRELILRFPLKEHHPEITQRYEALCLTLVNTPQDIRTIELYRREIKTLLPKVDFKGMLIKAGVSESCFRKNHQGKCIDIPYYEIKRALDSRDTEISQLYDHTVGTELT